MRRYILWLFRSWPALAVLLLMFSHFLLLELPCVHEGFLCWNNSEINKVISLLLQITGGFSVLYSIDSNIYLFKKSSLLSLPYNWLKDFPKSKATLVTGNIGMNVAYTFSDASCRIHKKTEGIEGEIEYLQDQINWIKEDFQSNKIKTMKYLSEINNEINTNHNETSERITDVNETLESVSTGGFKIQVFGVCLMVYGSVLGYVA